MAGPSNQQQNRGGPRQRGGDRVNPEPVEVVNASPAAALAKSEFAAQLEAAHMFPRSIQRFMDDALTMATINQDVAESCMYALPRRDKDGKEIQIVGPSARLAEICASAYGNIHSGARVTDEGDDYIEAQGVAWDLEKNNKVVIHVSRNIRTSGGRRYSADMIVMTGNAAISIAHRNAIFKCIPRSYVDEIFDRVKRVAVGDAQTLTKRRDELFAKLQKLGVHPDRIFARLGKQALRDVDLNDLALLIALGTAIKEETTTIDEAFPPVVVVPKPEEEGQRVSVMNTPPNGQPATQGAPPVPTVADAFRASNAPQNPAAASGGVPATTPPAPVAVAPAAPPPPEPEMEAEDVILRDKFRGASAKLEVNLAANLLVAAKDRIGRARYKALYAEYTAANERIETALKAGQGTT